MGLFSKKHDGGSEIAVSVLTPIYNVEKYLPECLDSLKAQKLKNIEFICINDGSTDGSLDILRRYAADDPRFVIIDKPNSGYGASMNCGLDKARGEYIGIVESDDVASPKMFKKLYSFAKKNDCDIVKSNYFEYDGTNDVFQDVFGNFRLGKPFDVRDDLEVMKALPIIWAAIYRRSMLVDNNVRFNETPGASFQDTSFVFQAWVASRRIALLKDAFLHYRVSRAESSVKSDSKVFEVCKEYELSYEFMHRDPRRVEDFGKLVNVIKLGTYRWNYNRIAEQHRPAFCDRWSQELRHDDAEGLLDAALFTPQDWQVICAIRDDPATFVASHPEM